MSASHFCSSLDEVQDECGERGLWYRLSSSAVLVGAGIGWTSAVIACCLAAPISLAFSHSRDERRASLHDDL
jgi:hypothetical protein